VAEGCLKRGHNGSCREKTVRKTIIPPNNPHETGHNEAWLDLEQHARVEVTSEQPGHPIEAALTDIRKPSWRAARAGAQTVRLIFDQPLVIRRVWLHFIEAQEERTQEFVLRWGNADILARELFRQQWTFSPGGSTEETEDFRVHIEGVTRLELMIMPNISGGEACASLAELRLA
jgi:hypothetical protein